MYGATALFFFLIGGIEALLIRIQLAAPERQAALAPTLYNQVFTMHGTTMIFLVVMPLGAAFMPTTSSRCRSGPATSRSPG